MADYEKHPNTIFRTADKEFVVHPSSMLNVFDETDIQRSLTPPPSFANPREFSAGRRGSLQPVVYRHKTENPVEAVRRLEIRRAILSSPSYGGISPADNDERFTAIANSSDYREGGLKKLKSNSWESIARWEKENEFLFTLIEDECDWLKRLFPDESVSAQSFFKDIEDGVLLGKLAQLCQTYAENFAKENKSHVPLFLIYIHSRNKCQGRLGKFRRRENVELFLKWCRVQGIRESLLFESNDVVERTEEEGLRENAREIVLCLMEVARLGVKFGITPPQLILLEKEIELEEQMDSSVDGSISPMSVDSGVDTMDLFHYGSLDAQNKESAAGTTNENSDEDLDDDNYGRDTVDKAYCGDNNKETDGDNKRFESGDGETDGDKDSGEVEDNKKENDSMSLINNKDEDNKKIKKKRTKSSSSRNKKSDSRNRKKSSIDFPKSELHNKVTSITETYNILKITRLKEGKYIILGKVMFVRLLNNHCLVRIGGGWDTLEHYVITHVNKVAPDSFEQETTGSSSVNKDSSRSTRSRKTYNSFAKKSFLTKSTPNLLSINDLESVEITEDNDKKSTSNESDVRPVSTTPSSKDPYFVQKKLRKIDDRKISQAILKVQANVAGLKRAASLDWTHLKGHELSIPSFSTFDSISQEKLDQIKTMADIAIETNNTNMSDLSQHVNGTIDDTADLAVPNPVFNHQNDEQPNVDNTDTTVQTTDNTPDTVKPPQSTSDPKEKPKIKKTGTTAKAGAGKVPGKVLTPTSKTAKQTATKGIKPTANGTTSRAPLSSRTTTSTKPPSSSSSRLSSKPISSTTTKVKSTTTSKNTPGTTVTKTTTIKKTPTTSLSTITTTRTTTTKRSLPTGTTSATSKGKTVKSTALTTQKPVTSTQKAASKPASATTKMTTTAAAAAATKSQLRSTATKPVDSSTKKNTKISTAPPTSKTTKTSSGTATRVTTTKPGTKKSAASKPISTARSTKPTTAPISSSSSSLTKKPKLTGPTKPLDTAQTKKSSTTKKATSAKTATTLNKSKTLAGGKSEKSVKKLDKKVEELADKKADQSSSIPNNAIDNTLVAVTDTLIVVSTAQVLVEDDSEPISSSTPDPTLPESGVPQQQQAVDIVTTEEEVVPDSFDSKLTPSTDEDILLVINEVKIPNDDIEEKNEDENSISKMNDENVSDLANGVVVTEITTSIVNDADITAVTAADVAIIEEMTSTLGDADIIAATATDDVVVTKEMTSKVNDDNIIAVTAADDVVITEETTYTLNDADAISIKAGDDAVVTEETTSIFTLIAHEDVKEYDSENEEDFASNKTIRVTEKLPLDDHQSNDDQINNANLGTIESASTTSGYTEDIVYDDDGGINNSRYNTFSEAIHHPMPSSHSNMMVECDADLYCVTPLVSGNFEDSDLLAETPKSGASPLGSPVKSSLEASSLVEPQESFVESQVTSEDVSLQEQFPDYVENTGIEEDSTNNSIGNTSDVKTMQEEHAMFTSDLIPSNVDNEPLDEAVNTNSPIHDSCNDPTEDVAIPCVDNSDGRDQMCSPDGVRYSEDRVATPLPPAEDPELQSPRNFSEDLPTSDASSTKSPSDIQVHTEDYQSNAVDVEVVDLPTEQFKLEQNPPLDSESCQSSSDVAEEEIDLQAEQFTLEQAPPLLCDDINLERSSFEAWRKSPDQDVGNSPDQDSPVTNETRDTPEEESIPKNEEQVLLFTKREVDTEDSTETCEDYSHSSTTQQYYGGQVSFEAEAIAKAVDTQPRDFLSDSEESASSQSPNHHVMYSEQALIKNVQETPAATDPLEQDKEMNELGENFIHSETAKTFDDIASSEMLKGSSDSSFDPSVVVDENPGINVDYDDNYV